MIIKSVKLGDIEVAEENCIEFSQGLLGFETVHRFAVIERDAQSPFYFLQAIDNPAITFIVVDPFKFFPDYQVALADDKLNELAIHDKKAIYILCLATIPAEYQQASVNLMAPLVINLPKRCGQQVILEKTNYQTKHFLFAKTENERLEGEK